MTLLQTAVIAADQNGRKNAGKTNCGNEDLVFSCKCDQGWQKKATPDEVSIKQPKTSLEFGLPSQLLALPKETSQFLVQSFVVVGFFKINLFCYFFSAT